MKAIISPKTLAGTVPAIASKSMAHRLIIAAALASGPTQVICNTTCADIDATVRCLEALGAKIETTLEGYLVHPVPKSTELGLLKALHGAELDCGESGSTLRFMLPVACALGAHASLPELVVWVRALLLPYQTKLSQQVVTLRGLVVFRSRPLAACALDASFCRAM